MPKIDLSVPRALAKKITAKTVYTFDFKKFQSPARKIILEALTTCTYPRNIGYDSQPRSVIDVIARAAPCLLDNEPTRLRRFMSPEKWQEVKARALLLDVRVWESTHRAQIMSWKGINTPYEIQQKNAKKMEAFIRDRLQQFPWREHVPACEVEIIDAAAEAVRTRSTFDLYLETGHD